MRWIYNDIDADLVLDYARKLSLPFLHSQILLSRDLDTKDKINTFFHPKHNSFYDPFLLKDMEKSIGRIISARENNEKVLIYGDYDVDGITSASVLYLFLTHIGIEADYYIPDREKDGYGLSKGGIDIAVRKEVSLIITCDCGVTSFDEIEYANTHNIDTIVTDHHKPSKTLPKAFSLVNPKREDDEYPFKDLCGAGVVFKLMQAYNLQNNIPVEDINIYLDLIAMGTAADMVSITDENRQIVSMGLELLNNTQRIGISELVKISNLRNKTIGVTEIVFILAPRLNAVGRLGEAGRAVKLLTTEDQTVARDFSEILNSENLRRRDIEKEVMDEALLHIKYKYNGKIPRIIVLADDKWHSGVIGIVCSKLKERYNRPIILITVSKGIGKGSGRSVSGFDLYNALNETSEYLDTFGGHVMAAGLTIQEENIMDFEEHINRYADEVLSDDLLEPKLKLEADIEIEAVNRDLLDLMDNLQPFGPGNMRPKFSLCNMTAFNSKIIGNNHLKFRIKNNNLTLDCIAWNLAEKFELVMTPGQTIDIAFIPQINRWNGNEMIQLVIKDIRTGK